MSVVHIELHERWAGERISELEYDILHLALARIGYERTARQSNQNVQLLPGCYYAKDASHAETLSALDTVKARLRNRQLSGLIHTGMSFGYNLQPAGISRVPNIWATGQHPHSVRRF